MRHFTSAIIEHAFSYGGVAIFGLLYVLMFVFMPHGGPQ